MLLAWVLALAVGIAATGLVFAAVAGIVLAIRRERRRGAWRGWTGVPLGCGCAPLLVLGALIGLPWTWDSVRPASGDYEEALGAMPPASVTGLDGKTRPGFDSRAVYLGFDRTPAARTALDRQLAGATRGPDTDLIDSGAFGGDVPDWWHAAHGWVGHHDCSDVRHTPFVDFRGWDDIVIADCPSRKRIFVLASRVD